MQINTHNILITSYSFINNEVLYVSEKMRVVRKRLKSRKSYFLFLPVACKFQDKIRKRIVLRK